MIGDEEPECAAANPHVIVAIWPLEWRLSCSCRMGDLHINIGPFCLTIGW